MIHTVMALSKELYVLAGKSSDLSNELYLPAYVHCIDTAEVTEYLVTHWISEHELRSMGFSDKEEAVRLVKLLGMLHDIGKITPAFQDKISRMIRRLREILCEMNIDLSDSSKLNFGHAEIGEAILRHNGIDEKICEIVGSHHGKPQDGDSIDKIKYAVSRAEEPWNRIWREWIDYSLEYAGYADVSEIPQNIGMPAQMLLTGLLITADWIASDQNLFPPIDIENHGTDIESRISEFPNVIKRLKIPECWNCKCVNMSSQIFEKRFGFPPNAVQNAVLDIVNNAEKPIMMIIEAQMGIGKTESALAAAEVMGAKFGMGGVFFGLPTQATTNCIFERSMEWLSCANREQTLSIRLAHSNAGLENSYLSLPSVESINIDDKESEKANIVTHSWFDGRKKALLADFVIGTVDQLLMASLKQRHIMLRHLGLAGKVVIIDECHAYSAYMNVYLDRTLRWLGEYKTPVIILSATLPAKRRNELIKAYMGDNYRNVQIPDTLSYPLISWTDGTIVKQKSDFGVDFPNKTVCIKKTDEDGICDILGERLYDGGCVGIIVNSVKKAQRLAKKIKDELPLFETELFHSQFIMTDRAKKERELIGHIGKNSAGDSRNRIIIGTQVLEQSLDLDFDLMITELCPVDLLLQRIGRLHRHDRERPNLLREPVCYVIDTYEDKFDEASEYIYGKWLLGKTRRILPETITLPHDISGLVEKVYGDYTKDELSAEENDDYYEYKSNRKNDVGKANAFCITEPIPEPEDEYDETPTLHNMFDKGYDINNEKKSEAKVRDGEDSVEVIVLKQTEVGYVETVGGDLKVSSLCCPNDDDIRKIAKERIRLPHSLCTEREIEKTISALEKMSCAVAEFQTAKPLRGELFLILDKDTSAVVNGYRLIYDRELGLITEKTCEEE